LGASSRHAADSRGSYVLMTDQEWLAEIKAGTDVGWKRVWERVIAPEAASSRSSEMMRRYSLTDGDLMGLLYEEMLGRGKIELFRGEGSLEGWLKRYVRGFVLNANPRKHDELSIEGAAESEDGTGRDLDLEAKDDHKVVIEEAWRMTLWCFRKLWNEDPERCYVHLLKTRFNLSSEEIRDFLEISSTANVDQIFSRSIKYMRQLAVKF